MRKCWLIALMLVLVLWAAPVLAETVELEPIHAQVTIPANYTVITRENLTASRTFLMNKGIDADEAALSWRDNGVLLQAWHPDGDAMLQITAVQDEEATRYFDIDEQTVATRAVYRKAHLSGEKFKPLGITYSSAEWKKTSQYGRFLMLRYTQKVEGQVHHRGFARKTIRNGYTILLDYQVYGRKLQNKDDAAMNKIIGTWYFNEELPVPASAAARIVVNNPPPEQTNTNTFTYDGTAEKDMTLTCVITRMASANNTMVLTETANKQGKFSVKVALPDEGVYLMTVTVEKNGQVTEELVYPAITYDKTTLPVNFHSKLPAQITEDEVVISGTSIRGAKVQFIQGIENKTVKVGSNKKFSFTMDTSKEGDYHLTVVFSKKGMDTQRYQMKGTRLFTEDQIRANAREGAKKPAYSTLMDKLNAYTGHTLTYTAYVTGIENVNGEWYVSMAMRQTKSGQYKEPFMVVTTQEPVLTVGTQVKFYGVCQGGYEILSEEGGSDFVPLMELIFWDK